MHDVFHVSHLIPENKNTIVGRRQEPPLPIEVEGEVEYEIDHIIKERKTRAGVFQFWVRWKGYGEEEDQWINEYDMHAPELIEEFRSRQPPKKTRRKR